MENVVAAVRCRPIRESEKSAGYNSSVQVLPDVKQVILTGDKTFSFNHVYSDKSSQQQIYEETVQPVVGKVLSGLNACVLAYGQTGSGKTYTMGTNAKDFTPGIVHKALHEIFANKGDKNAAEVQVSFLEVYKEEVLDLLTKEKRKMQVVDFKPVGLTKITVHDVNHALSVMEEGVSNRHIGSTNANMHSSRSHAVFTIHVTKNSEQGLFTSKLYLVDLAGSESVSQVSGDTRREGVLINKGLLQLGMVVAALSSGGQDHIPYRNSSLTAILKDTLSQQNLIVVIACISPLDVDMSDTLNTLNFANRVKNIKLNPNPKQRVPLVTPFKTPFKKMNTTIATPGGRSVIQRPPLRPFNKTFDSPRTPRSLKKQVYPTSTPFQTGLKPLVWEPTPIPNPPSSMKRRSSSEWNALDISSSTIVDNTTAPKPKAQEVQETSLFPSTANETWLRSLIADVIREELKSHTLLGNTMMDPPPSKQPRRSVRLSTKNNILEQNTNDNFVPNLQESTIGAVKDFINENTVLKSTDQSSSYCKPHQHHEKSLAQGSSVRRSIRLSMKLEQQKNSAKLDTLPRTKGSLKVTAPLRRSTRLSLASCQMHDPADSPQTPSVSDSEASSMVSVKNSQRGRKPVRRSKRLSMVAQVTPGNAQKHLNARILNILKFGDVKKLQSLPTIGPKTAVIICNHRLLNGPIEALKDLANVQGLSLNFSKRFYWANNIVLEGEGDSTANEN